MKAKDLYAQAAVLLSTGDPSNAITAANFLHSIVYSKNDGSKDCSLWKGHAAIDLATLYLVGVESCDYVAEDGNIYADTYIEPDLLKAYDLCRRAIKHKCYDGVVIIAEIYLMLHDYYHAAQLYAAAVKFGYKGADDAKKILDKLVEDHKIDEIPENCYEPTWDPVLEFHIA